MKTTFQAKITERGPESVTMILANGSPVTVSIPEIPTEMNAGMPVWVTISSDPPSDAKEVLNTILGGEPQ